ncbi:MAG: hypothetical protein JO345_23455 [Streptosporangiaceae bacterium]|nr:hypothetical protein [Pseudonocardiales bacterium]MBV9448856.1 hypothetical protein [Streptosporangiaceae bacterium]
MPANISAVLGVLFADPVFDPQHGLSADDQDAVTYRQLGHINDSIAAHEPLASGNHELLRTLLELTAAASPSLFMAFFLHHSMATGATVEYGGEAGGLHGFGAIMMTELGYASSSANILTEAHFDPTTGDFALRTPSEAAVKFPSNIGAGGPAKWGVVSARLFVDRVDRGPFLFRLQLRDFDGPCPGVSIKNIPAFPQLQLDYGSARFTDARVPRSGWLPDGATITDGVFHDPLGGPRQRMLRTVSVSRLAHGSAALGLAAVARASLTIAAPFAGRRLANNRYGERRPLIAFRNEQRRLVGAMASAFAATALARRTAAWCMRIGTSLSGSQLRTASLVKVAVSRLASDATTRAQETCGAAGYVAQNRLLQYRDFAVTFHNSGGDNQMYMLNAAWAMIDGDYKPPAGLAQATGVLDRSLALLQRREHHLYRELVAARDDATNRGVDAFTVANDLAESAQRFVEAYLNRLTVEETRQHANDHDATEALLSICELLAVNGVLAHDGWHLAQETVTAPALRELSAAADRIYDRLTGEMETLVGMLDIPPTVLRSPLVADDLFAEVVPPLPAMADE